MSFVHVGRIQIKSGKILVTDPSYEKEVGEKSYTFTIGNAKKGDWNVYQETEGRIRSRLLILHESVGNISRYPLSSFNKVCEEIAVDSGQCGFADFDEFPDDPRDALNEVEFYNKVCDGACDSGISIPEKNDSYPFAFSSSGWGDGTYSLFTKEVDGETIGAYLSFVYEDEEEECCNCDCHR